MAKDAKALAAMLRIAFNDATPFRTDPYLSRKPFDETEYASNRRLTIGYFDSGGFFDPIPAVRRAVVDTLRKLEAAGHKIGEAIFIVH